MLLGRDRPDMGAARVNGEAKRGGDCLMPGMLEMLGGDGRAAAQGEQAQDVLDQPEFDVGDAGSRDAHERHARIGRQARLDIVGLRDAQIVVGCLQFAIVEKRHLDRNIGGDGLDQQRDNLFLRPLHLFGAGDLDDGTAGIGTGLATDALCDLVHAAVRREPGAPGQQACDDQKSNGNGRAHGLLPIP